MTIDTTTLWDDRVHRTVRGHARWVVPLLLAPVVHWACLRLMLSLEVGGGEEMDIPTSLGILALAALAYAGALVCLLLVVLGLHRIWRSWRRADGHYTKADRRRIESMEAASASRRADRHALLDALRVREALLRGEQLRELPPTDVLPAPGETFCFRGVARYLRFYGQDVSYSTSSTVAFGRPTFVAAMLVTSAVSNASARSRAQAMARAQWREDQVVEVLVSNHRLRCRTQARGWLSFDFHGITAIYPELSTFSVVLEFEVGEPLMLSGRVVPAACMVALHTRLGPDALRSHPAAHQLLETAGA